MKKNCFVALILVVVLFYIISPIDIIPDPLPVVGWVNGLAVGLRSGNKRLLVKMVPGLADEIPRSTGLDVFF